MTPLTVQYAVACLGRLQDHSQSETEIAQEAGIPVSVCTDILARFEQAGIVRRDEAGTLALTSERLSSLQVLEALWGPAPQPAFRMLFGQSRGASRWTKQWAIPSESNFHSNS